MPRIRTIEEDFEYQMTRCLREFCREYELDPAELDGEKMMEIIWYHLSDFGKIVYERMNTWMDEAEWLEKVKE